MLLLQAARIHNSWEGVGGTGKYLHAGLPLGISTCMQEPAELGTRQHVQIQAYARSFVPKAKYPQKVYITYTKQLAATNLHRDEVDINLS